MPGRRFAVTPIRPIPPRRQLPAVLTLGVLALAACRGPEPGATPERITIPAGASFSQVTDSLVARGVVEHRGWFKFLARVRGLDRSVQAGLYEVRPGESAWQVLNLLRDGRVVTTRFTVPEGLSLFEVADLAQRELQIPRDSVIAAARDPREAEALGLAGPTLEGFLLPDTYQLPAGTDGRDLVRYMGRAFLRAWRPEWARQLDSLGLTRRQAVTLASIVEGEARVDDERAIIAGVYLNRLRIGMALQADPTVQYAIELKAGKPKPRLYEKDYQIPSLYNTYLHPGLPPGPFNSPGLRSIVATLHPADVPFLYVVAGAVGRHRFRRSYREHLAAVAAARRERR
ncbi:MAG: endolytic transglycosylase MltG [Gemmatimonadales bacterium]